MMNTEVSSKRMQMLKELVPGLTRVAVLANSVNPIHSLFMRETESAARTLALELQPIEVHGPEDFEAAFAAATRGKAGALIAFDDALTLYYRSRIVALAAANRLPAMYGYREFPDEGGLISYGANLASHYRHAAKYVDKVLKGVKPADLPIEQPAKFELVINLKTAKALGLTVTPALLARADEVIE
jgi:putative ABC transport system substrate-binding protein